MVLAYTYLCVSNEIIYHNSMYYKPMGDLLTCISSEQGGLIIRTEFIYELPYYISILYQRVGWAYNTYYTVYTTYMKLDSPEVGRAVHIAKYSQKIQYL